MFLCTSICVIDVFFLIENCYTYRNVESAYFFQQCKYPSAKCFTLGSYGVIEENWYYMTVCAVQDHLEYCPIGLWPYDLTMGCVRDGSNSA